MINQLRETEKNLVLLDCGNFMSERDYGRDLIAEVTLKGMQLMKYDAVALGPQDLLLGPGPLRAILGSAQLPVVASNLVVRETGKSFEKTSALFEKGGLRVGVVSVISQAPQEERERNPFLKEEIPFEKPSMESSVSKTLPEMGEKTGKNGFKILPMEEAVGKAVREIRGKTDMVVLLSHAGYDDTCDLVNKVPGIDLAIYWGGGKNTPGKTSDKTLLVMAPTEGKSIGYVKFGVEGTEVALKQKKMISLSCGSREPTLPEDAAVVALVGDDFERKLVELRREREKQQEAQVLKEAKELWKLSPREFLEMEMKKKAAAGTNEPAGNPFPGR